MPINDQSSPFGAVKRLVVRIGVLTQSYTLIHFDKWVDLIGYSVLPLYTAQ